MKRYRMTSQIGDGTYGTVARAVSESNGEVVAIKKMKRKFYSWEECVNLREVRSLKSLSHPNIIKLREVIRENDELYFIFEHLDLNLYERMRGSRRLYTEIEIKEIMIQIFRGLAYMHKHGYFHRDIKPENILCKAREIRSLPPYTDYVSTRWYRAPELLLHSLTYNSPVDIWASACILSELFTFQPLFPGKNETDQLMKICSVLGAPSANNPWYDGSCLSRKLGFSWPNFRRIDLRDLISKINPDISVSGIELLESLLRYDPQARPTASLIVSFPYFQVNTDSYQIGYTDTHFARPVSWNLPDSQYATPASIEDKPALISSCFPKDENLTTCGTKLAMARSEPEDFKKFSEIDHDVDDILKEIEVECFNTQPVTKLNQNWKDNNSSYSGWNFAEKGYDFANLPNCNINPQNRSENAFSNSPPCANVMNYSGHSAEPFSTATGTKDNRFLDHRRNDFVKKIKFTSPGLVKDPPPRERKATCQQPQVSPVVQPLLEMAKSSTKSTIIPNMRSREPKDNKVKSRFCKFPKLRSPKNIVLGSVRAKERNLEVPEIQKSKRCKRNWTTMFGFGKA